ncbi:MAG TPA: FecR domain-containing protein [Rariglobus sp.]|jgi:hypothetical protein|nr:FecR domain-containing protein [Rariglobus sp.]
MKSKLRYLSTLAPWLCAVTVLTVFSSQSRADDGAKRKNPTSKLYVADVEGDSSINTGDKINELTKKSVYSAEGTIIETKSDSRNALVLSNGTGISIDPDTKLEVKRFLQEPFTPNRNDAEIEPSVSQTAAFLPRGSVGLCTSKMVAGSTMNYSTPQANITIHGRKVVIESSGNTTTVSMLEGDATVNGGASGGGDSLQVGQQAVITRNSPTEPPTIKIQPIPPEQKEALSDKVNMACMARKTVYFSVAERHPNDVYSNVFSETTDAGEEIVPVEVLPGTIDPVVTVSPSAITRNTP